MKKGKYIGIELQTGTGFTNVLIGLNIDGQNTVEFCNEADIELWEKGEIRNPWSQDAKIRIVKDTDAVFDSNHRIIPKTKKLTITRERFLEWYYGYGQDQENTELQNDLAKSIIHQMYTVGFGSMSVQEIFDGCNQDSIRAYFTQEFDGQTDDYDIELSDLPFSYKLKLIN